MGKRKGKKDPVKNPKPSNLSQPIAEDLKAKVNSNWSSPYYNSAHDDV